MSKQRPTNIAVSDLPRLMFSLPAPGIVSLLHRASGVLLVLSIPVLLYLLQNTLGSAEAFAQLRSCIGHPLVKLFLLAVLWAFLHHFCAGIRFLLLDMHIGLPLKTARHTARAVLGVSLLLTLVIGALLW
jgi:succinate dehydrogenase / fumarate reductase cytochrome b subunit